MAASMLIVKVKQWVEEKVDSGLNWPAIKKMLRLDAAILDAVSLFIYSLEMCIIMASCLSLIVATSPRYQSLSAFSIGMCIMHFAVE